MSVSPWPSSYRDEIKNQQRTAQTTVVFFFSPLGSENTSGQSEGAQNGRGRVSLPWPLQVQPQPWDALTLPTSGGFEVSWGLAFPFLSFPLGFLAPDRLHPILARPQLSWDGAVMRMGLPAWHLTFHVC